MNKPLISHERTYPIVTMAAAACAALLVLTACGPKPDDSARASDYAAANSTLASRSATAGQPVPPAAPRVQAPLPRADMGRISSIEKVTTPGKTNGTGALIGGVLGAAVGNEVGGDSRDSRAIGTGLGAVGGAVLGSEIERRNKPATVSYRIHVRLDNGDSRTFESASNDGLHVGDRVRVDGSLLRRA